MTAAADGGSAPRGREPVTYVTEVWCPPTDDGRHQLRSHMKQPAPEPEPETGREPEAGT